MKKLCYLLLLLNLLFVNINKSFADSVAIQAESMVTGGSYAGKISSPFTGIGLYGNGDNGTISANFPDGTGIYVISITGASNNSNSAGVTVYVNSLSIKAFTFAGTSSATQTVTAKIEVTSSPLTVQLKLETDNGSSDTYIDKITFTYQGPVVVRNPPVLPTQGAYYTDIYRNMFVEAGYNATDVNAKIQNIWQQFFYGDSATQAVYYPVDANKAYILDVNNGDVRSEGMSYGMMICVQLDKKTEFDKLWTWAKTYMQHQTGSRQGYFAWRMNKNGTMMDQNPASDGEEYFVMALMFAANRWGNGDGIYNYSKEANDILDLTMSKEVVIKESIMNIINTTENQVVFVPYASSAKFTDPSYHLPAFYQLWSIWANSNKSVWMEVANKSREMFQKFANTETGLMPDYANFDGTARSEGNHADFRFDAWRCMMNMAVDYAWFKADEGELALVNRIHTFFSGKGITSYGNQFNLSGTQLVSDHSAGLVACNSTGSLASNQAIAWEFIDDLYATSIPSGKYRYYDGLLYFMNYLHLSGNFKIYKPQTADSKVILSENSDSPEVYSTITKNLVTVLKPEKYKSFSIVCTTSGQVLASGILSSANIDFSKFPVGIYILRLNDLNDKQNIIKIIRN